MTLEGWSQSGNLGAGGIPYSAEASKPKLCGAGHGEVRRKKGSYAPMLQGHMQTLASFMVGTGGDTQEKTA